MFPQTTDVNFVCFIHFDNTNHIAFTLHVYELTFSPLGECGGDGVTPERGGCQARDHCSSFFSEYWDIVWPSLWHRKSLGEYPAVFVPTKSGRPDLIQNLIFFLTKCFFLCLNQARQVSTYVCKNIQCQDSFW